MAKESSIEWTEATWNPWHGCKKVSPGCKHCYMYRDKKRFGQDPTKVVRSKTKFDDPLKWVEPKIIFACSWSDWFIEEADQWRDKAWDIIRRTPHHVYQILTKRPERINQCLPTDWGDGWPNVWLGVSIENQQYANERIPQLIKIPARVRFLSCEPLLGEINLQEAGAIKKQITEVHPTYFDSGVYVNKYGLIDWVIVGGESGPRNKIRPMRRRWVRELLAQCLITFPPLPFFFKQHGGSKKIGGAWGGRMLDGRTWDEMPRLLEVKHA